MFVVQFSVITVQRFMWARV